jgi:oligopeptide/dipeptide ABC transporter ATP-binding protein
MAPGRGQKPDEFTPKPQKRIRAPIQGCPFEDRCFLRVPHCKEEEPELREIKSGHWVSCFEAKLPS